MEAMNKNEKLENFKEAFDSADNNFLKKVKECHPSLTPNDLRLCAYLRLNLSSKEISPLLNISVRSVEIKRYRLRKKIDLPHEKGLVEYILSI
jgi:DNA-binding CsgD family transcriptional regulator